MCTRVNLLLLPLLPPSGHVSNCRRAKLGSNKQGKQQQYSGRPRFIHWCPIPSTPNRISYFVFFIVITFFGIWFHFVCARECQLIWDWWTACAIGRGERPQETSAPALATCCLIGLFSHKSTRCNWFCCCSCAAFE